MIDQEKYNRSLQGARNRSAGALFEGMIEKSLSIHRSRGEAVIAKTPEPVKILSGMDKNGRFRACFEKKGEPDYKGVLKGGRCVVLEAKSTTAVRLLWGTVKPHQRACLDAYMAAGAKVYILAYFGKADTYRIDWEVWRDMPKYFGRSFITEDDVQQFKLPRINGLCPDILHGIRADSYV